MTTVTPQELLLACKREEMPLEMTLGHVIQNLVKLHTAFVDLQADVDRLIAYASLQPNVNGRHNILSKPNKTFELE